jgi:hypothetical protein
LETSDKKIRVGDLSRQKLCRVRKLEPRYFFFGESCRFSFTIAVLKLES